MARKKENDQALTALQEAYDICRILDNDRGRLDVARRVIPLLLTMEQLDGAGAGIEAGLELADKLSDQSSRLDLLTRRAELAEKRNRPGEAVQDLAEAVDICREHEDVVGEILTLERLGPILRAARQDQAALEVYRRLAELAAKAGDFTRHGLALVGVGQLSHEAGRVREALESYRLAEKIYLSAGLKVWADKVGQEIERITKAGPHEGGPAGE